MVNSSAAPVDSAILDKVLLALADPTRRGILRRLARGPATPSELLRPLSMSWPALSKHVRTLERAGLLRREVSGRNHNLYLQAHPLRQVEAWLADYRAFWGVQLGSLENFLEQTDPAPSQPPPQSE